MSVISDFNHVYDAANLIGYLECLDNFVEWIPSHLKYFVDGQLYHVIENWASDTGGIGPFDQNFDIIMNLQVGGWPGDPVPSSAGSQMEIDWVQVYQDNPAHSMRLSCLDSAVH